MAIRWGSISKEDSGIKKAMLTNVPFCRKRIQYSNSSKVNMHHSQRLPHNKVWERPGGAPVVLNEGPTRHAFSLGPNHQCAWNISHPGSAELNLHRCFLHLTGPAGIFLPQQLTFLEVSLRPDASHQSLFSIYNVSKL